MYSVHIFEEYRQKHGGLKGDRLPSNLDLVLMTAPVFNAHLQAGPVAHHVTYFCGDVGIVETIDGLVKSAQSRIVESGDALFHECHDSFASVSRDGATQQGLALQAQMRLLVV